MPGHANFVGGPAARIRKLTSSSSHPNRRYTRLGGPSRIFKPRRENIQFDFPWVPAVPSVHGRRDEEEMEQQEEEEEGGGWMAEREGESSSAAAGGGGGAGKRGSKRKRKSVVLDLLDNNPTLGGFEAGKQALLDSDDWAGLHDSYISASDFLPSSPPASRHHQHASSPHEREQRGRRVERLKRVVSDHDEEWEERREGEGDEAYMQEGEDDELDYPDRYTFENPQESSSNGYEHEHDPNQALVDFDPPQPSPSPPRHQPSPPQQQQQQDQQQNQNQHQNQNQQQHPPQSPHSSIATVTLSFPTSSNGVARAHPPPRDYPVPSSFSEGGSNVTTRSMGTHELEGDPIVEEENEDLQLFAEGNEVETSNSRNDDALTRTTTKKKKQRFSPDSKRITLGSSTIFNRSSDRLLGSPPYVSPSPPGPSRSAMSVVASQQLKEDEQRWRASQKRPTPTPTPSNFDNVEVPNVMRELASRLKLPDISGRASPLQRSRPPSGSGSERDARREEEDQRGRDEGGVVQKEEEFEYQLNFDSRRWETFDEEEEEEEHSWNDHRRDEGESSSQEKDFQSQ